MIHLSCELSALIVLSYNRYVWPLKWQHWSHLILFHGLLLHYSSLFVYTFCNLFSNSINSYNFFIRPIYRARCLLCFLVSNTFQLCVRYLGVAGGIYLLQPPLRPNPASANSGCCNKFSSPLRNTDSFGCKVARSPITGQSHWLDSPLNIILDMLKGALAACAGCSREY